MTATRNFYSCDDCEYWFEEKPRYSYDLKNVCGRCYAIHANHPSTRKLVKSC